MQEERFSFCVVFPKTTPSFGSLLFQAKRAYNDNVIVTINRLIPLIALVVLVMILAKLPALVVSKTSALLIDSSIPDDETITSQTEASNSFRATTKSWR
jgi:hypothetical protein